MDRAHARVSPAVRGTTMARCAVQVLVTGFQGGGQRFESADLWTRGSPIRRAGYARGQRNIAPTPRATCPATRRSTVPTTAGELAPSAERMPISRVRFATVKEVSA